MTKMFLRQQRHEMGNKNRYSVAVNNTYYSKSNRVVINTLQPSIRAAYTFWRKI